VKIVLTILLLAAPAASMAQDRGASVSGSVFASNMDSHTDVAFAGGFGYRFTRVVSFDIETTFVPNVHSPFPANPTVIQSSSIVTTLTGAASNIGIQVFPTPTYSNPGGRIVLFTNAVRIDIPTTASSLTPYFVAGGGIASIRRTADFTYPVFLPLSATALPAAAPPIRQQTERIASSSTDLALTIGGGLSIKLTQAISLDADLRLFRLLDEDDRNLGRFGVGVRYRF